MTDFCWAILSADKISRFCRSSDIALSKQRVPKLQKYIGYAEVIRKTFQSFTGFHRTRTGFANGSVKSMPKQSHQVPYWDDQCGLESRWTADQLCQQAVREIMIYSATSIHFNSH